MLWKKMLRDFWDNKGPYLASTLILVLGIMVFTGFSILVDNLKLSQNIFYTEQNFAHGFAQVKAIPSSEVRKLEAIDGINRIEGRIVHDAQVLFPNRTENVYLRLVSLDPANPNPINGVRLIQGIPLDNKASNIWLDNKFSAANSLALNDNIDIIARGKKRSLSIAGIGMGPEFIYAFRTPADIYPTPETFGIAYVPLGLMENFFSQQGAFNDLVFTLEPGVSFDDVKHLLEHELKPYGLLNLFSRDDQSSHLVLTEELKQQETMATMMPMIFLSVAAMILYIILKRLIEQQRGQIGILKAFGYTNREIFIHYLSYPLTLALTGSIIGGLLGIAMASPLTSFFLLFFNMPDTSGQFTLRYFILGIVLSVLFALFAGYQGCKKVLLLEPAEAMRPPAPTIGKRIWVENIPLIWNGLTVQGMMATRNLSRNKGRSIFIFIGIMFCFAISGFTWSMNGLIQKMLFDQYEKVELYDVKITLQQPLDQKAVTRELLAFPGVHNVEPLAEVPVNLQNSWLNKDVIVIGIAENSILYNILDKDYNHLAAPKDGLLLSERLALVLNGEVGSILTLNTLLPGSNIEEDKEIEVVGIIPQYLGINAYMEIGALQGFLRQDAIALAYMLSIDKEYIPLLKDRYRQSETIVAIDEKDQSLKQLQAMMATFGGMIYIFALIGVMVGFAIIYSSTIITLSERNRELASMMVLGMAPAEVRSVLTFEQWTVGVLAMIAGIPLAKAMMVGLSESFSNDLYTMPSTMTPSSFLLAFLITALSIWVAQLFAARKIKGLSLVEVLKSRE